MNLLKIVLALFVISSVAFSSCSKKSDKDDNGSKLNTWTFTHGTIVYKGEMLFESASLNTNPSAAGAYTLGVLGVEESTGFIFNVVLDLLDTTFTTKNYTSGVQGTDYWNSFYFSETITSPVHIYQSTNILPGAEMNYKVTSYDASKSIVTITFNGEASDTNGNKVNITNGKFTTVVDKL